MIKYDGTVRSAANSLIQFVYGDTGADTTKQYEFNMKIMEMGDTELAKKYKVKDEDLNKFGITKHMSDEHFEMIKAMRDKLRHNSIKARMDYITMEQNYMLPVNLNSIVENNRNDKTLKSVEGGEKLTGKYILQRLDEILYNDSTILMCIPEKDRKNHKSIKFQDEQIAKTSLKIALHSMLAPARCFYEYDYNKAQFDNAISQIVESYNKNIAEAGEMVGTIAAQAMGEPVNAHLCALKSIRL